VDLPFRNNVPFFRAMPSDVGVDQSTEVRNDESPTRSVA
jgi:hypothetical protein